MDTSARAPSPNGTAPQIPEEALDQLLHLIITGFFVLTDGQGALSKWSDPAELLFGLVADDALMEPFFGKLVAPTDLKPEGEAWRAFLENGGTPGTHGCLRVDAHRPGGGTFAMEAVFVPVKLDEGFDFSLFLEDLAFELPVDMMLLRMRQQHPVVIRALRAALADDQPPWEGLRTAGTLVAFRPMEETPWMDAAMQRREEEAAAADAELQSRIEAYEAPGVQGTDVYDLEDARAVIDRLKWATERIEELEKRSRISEDAVQVAADARVRAEAAERAALDAKAEISGVLADRPVDSSNEASRLELVARLERVERAATEASEAAASQRIASESERTRATELDHQRAELLARLEQLERSAEGDRETTAAVARARAELMHRLEALETSRAGGAEAAQAASVELITRLDAVERARAEEAAATRAELERLRAFGDVRSELEALKAQVAATGELRGEIEAIRARADTASGLLKRGEERDAAARQQAEILRSELQAALMRVEQLSEEAARVRAVVEAPPAEAGLSPEDRHRLEAAAHGAQEARSGLEAIRLLAEELRIQSAELREEGGHLQARLRELQDGDHQARHDVESLRREHEELRVGLEELRRERDEARQGLRAAQRLAEEAKAAAERGPPGEGDAPVAAAAGEVAVARARLDELAALVEAAEARAEEARAEAASARAEAAEVREEAREAQATAREAGERVDMVDRGTQTILAEFHTHQTHVEELAALSRSAQQDAAQSRADAGEARVVVAKLESVVAAAREQMGQAVAEAAGAREQAAAAAQAAGSVRGIAAGVGDVSREVAAATIEPLTVDVAELRTKLAGVGSAVEELRLAPVEAGPELTAALDALRADVSTLRSALEGAEGGDATAVQALSARLAAVEAAGVSVPDGLDTRMESLRDGLSGALGKLETLSVELAATRTESGAGHQVVEQRLADTAAELMAARTDAEQARRGLEGLRDELTSLREYAAAARSEAVAAKEAASTAHRARADEERQVDELRTEVKSVLASVQEFKHGFEEARQAAVAARRDAESARSAAERAGAVNEMTTEKFTEVWQKMLTSPAPQRSDSGVSRGLGARATTSRPVREAPPARDPRPGFDDDPRPMAVLDLRGKFTQLNPAFAKLVGYQEHEFGKATWPSVLDRALYMAQRAEFDELIVGERETAAVQSTYMHGQGIMVLVNGAVELVRDDAGRPEHLLLVTDAAGLSATH